MQSFDVVARAPGRVNLIGEHTDHQDGFVLPMAIGLATTVRARRRDDRLIRFASDAVPGVATVDADDDPRRVEPSWARCPAAVVHLLRAEGVAVPGFDAEISGDLPLGAGLSSSAALDVAVALAALELTGSAQAKRLATTDRFRLAAICRDAEALGSGVRCGIMDPFASLFGQRGAALLLDCRSMAFHTVVIPMERMALVVADSGVRHSLADGGYGDRRAECEEAARRLGLTTLRDASLRDLGTARDGLGPVLVRRVRHVVSENARVLAAEEALEKDDVAAFGRLLDASHESLRDDFEVSCRELDVLVELARSVPGVLGSRMTGGGFGGSTVTAVRPDAVPALVAAFRHEGTHVLGRPIPARVVGPCHGAEVSLRRT